MNKIPYRYDIVGSFLRSERLKHARENFNNNLISKNELKKIENNSEIIDILHTIHGRCSGGALHNGTESEENPVDKDELKSMLKEIKNIQTKH